MAGKAREDLGLIEQLKIHIEESGLSCFELGAKTKVNRTNISRFLAGERGLTLDSAAKIAAHLSLTLTRSGRRPSKR